MDSIKELNVLKGKLETIQTQFKRGMITAQERDDRLDSVKEQLQIHINKYVGTK